MRKFNSISSLFIIIILLATGCVSLNARVIANYSPNGYCEEGSECNGDATGDRSESSTPIASTLTKLVIRGGGYFLASNSDIINFLHEIETGELDGIDYVKLNELLDSAINNIVHARAEYKLLVDLAFNTPYNPVFIEQLLRFDYYGFMYRKSIESSTFWDVVGYLAWGDINGYYYRLYSECGKLLNELYLLRSYIKLQKTPPMSYCWRTNRRFNNFNMFGQIGAEVFYDVSRILKYD